MSIPKVALIGYGYWGPNLLRNLYKVATCEVIALADPDQKRLEAAQKQYPELEISTDPAEILVRSDIDAVVLATPPNTHYKLAKRGLEHGKHLLIEKPLADNARDASELVDLAHKNNLTLMVDHTFIYSGAVQKIREIIRNNELGEVWYVDSVRINLGIFQQDVNVVWDLAPHDISILDYLIDAEPISVSATGLAPASYTDNSLEGIAYVTVRYDNSVLAHLHLSWLSPLKIRRMIIGGSRKLLVYDHLDQDHQVKIYDKGVEMITEGKRHKLLGERREGDMHAPKVDQSEPLERVCNHFIQCISNSEKPITDGNSGLKVVRIIEAAIQSMKTGGGAVSL